MENERTVTVELHSSPSTCTAESEQSKDWKRKLVLAAGFLMASEAFAVCLQEVHVHAKDLQPLSPYLELPIILTVVNTISLFVLLRFKSPHGVYKHTETLTVALLCNVIVEYLYNFWYIYSRNDSFAVGYFQPVVAVILLKCCTKTGVSIKTFAILVSMALCAGTTSGEVHILLNANRKAVIIFLVIFFICLRNIALKYLHKEDLVLRVRKPVAIPYCITVMSIAVIMSAFHLTYWALPVMFGLISMFASVTMLYMTSALLENFSILSVSVIGLVSQLLINAVCIPVEHAHNVFISAVGLLLLTAVIVYYFRHATHNISNSEVSNQEVFMRIEFCLFIGLVCGLIVYVFKPKISERDLNNLHYVGLDNVFKRLFNHQ